MRKLEAKKLYKKHTYYHVYNRGHRKSEICREKKDYKRLVDTIFRYQKKFDIVLVSYCIMPNHYHMILKLGDGLTDISRFMQRCMTSYASYFNRKYGLVGALFQNAFNARRIEDYEDLLGVVEYLKKNPEEGKLVKKGMGSRYKWFYLNKRSFKVFHRLGKKLTKVVG